MPSVSRCQAIDGLQILLRGSASFVLPIPCKDPGAKWRLRLRILSDRISGICTMLYRRKIPNEIDCWKPKTTYCNDSKSRTLSDYNSHMESSLHLVLRFSIRWQQLERGHQLFAWQVSAGECVRVQMSADEFVCVQMRACACRWM